MQIETPIDIYMDLYSSLVINQKELNIKTISYFKYYFNLNINLNNPPYVPLLLYFFFRILLHGLCLRCD